MKRPFQAKVLIVQAMMKQYREPFFEKLYHALRHEGVGLRVLYGQPPDGELKKSDNVELKGRYGVKVPNLWLFNDRLLYQPVMREALDADLVIVEQANKHLVNYPLLALSSLGLKKVAFWGHGRNGKAGRPGLSGWLKKTMWNRVDWWFAYTRGAAAYLAAHGVPEDRITGVQNSIDTAGFRRDLAGVPDAVIRAERSRLGIGDDARVGLFCGSLYADKRLGFLLDAAQRIKRRQPAFELLLVGGGAERPIAEKAASEFSWVHYAGPLFGVSKALYFRMAEFFVHPGALGLSILDAFAAGLPVLTTDIPLHGPEAEYLETGVNGVITPPDIGAFTDAAAGLLEDGESFRRLKDGAAASADRYDMDAMVSNFKGGITGCLALDPSPWRARWTMGRHTSA